MKIEEVKRNMNHSVIYGGSKYTLTGCILRKDKDFYYQAELLDETKRSVVIVRLEKVQGE